MSAADRRTLVLEAAIEEYGRTGIHATSTEAIAERAGVSQPYLFRLFGTKADLVTAAIEHHVDHLREVFRSAVANREADTSPLEAMGVAYIGLMDDGARSLQCQLHTWAAASDPAISEVARRTFRDVWDEVATLSDTSADEVRDFMAQGMLLTVLSSLDLMDLYGDPVAAAREMF